MSYLGGKLKKRMEAMRKVAPKVKKFVKSAIQRAKEKKFINFSDLGEGGGTDIGVIVNYATAHIKNLTGITQGDEPFRRQANSVDVYRINGKLVLKATDAVAPSAVRVVIVQDKSNTGTIPTVADVFPQYSQGAGRVDVAMQGIANGVHVDQMETENKERFNIIYDKLRYISGATDDSTMTRKALSINKKLKTRVYYKDSGATDESKGQIFLFVFTSYTGNDLSVQYNIRTYFTE